MLEDKNTQKTSLADLGEFGLINHITKYFKIENASTVTGIGDDAAVLDASKKQTLVTNCDNSQARFDFKKVCKDLYLFVGLIFSYLSSYNESSYYNKMPFFYVSKYQNNWTKISFETDTRNPHHKSFLACKCILPKLFDNLIKCLIIKNELLD